MSRADEIRADRKARKKLAKGVAQRMRVAAKLGAISRPYRLEDYGRISARAASDNPTVGVAVMDWPYWMEIMEALEIPPVDVAQQNHRVMIEDRPEEERANFDDLVHDACWFLGERGLTTESDPKIFKLRWE